MNFLAHLLLAGDDEGLRLGAMLGDFVSGREALGKYDAAIQKGIILHRHIDAHTDAMQGVAELRSLFQPPFRRYAGIIIDLALDHVLALRWDEYSENSLQEFDQGVRDMLARHDGRLPERLKKFMKYADQRGLFAAYQEESEILHSLRGLGRRLSRDNPLHRTGEIWSGFKPMLADRFESIFEEIQSDVADWLKSNSTNTGS